MSTNLFIGTWRLLSAEAKSSNGEVIYPFGKDATGFLMYGPDGYMAVTVMRPNRANFATKDFRGGTPEEKLAAFSSYLSYCGKYEVKGEKIVHQIDMSLFPNWSGDDQERFFVFSGDHLTLRTAPMKLAGAEVTAQMVWQRLS